jgi:hypothetical protein
MVMVLFDMKVLDMLEKGMIAIPKRETTVILLKEQCPRGFQYPERKVLLTG